MPALLRRRLHCHYCGKRSAHTNLRKFKCEHCLAVNYLDANGDITDPPPEATGASTQYADRQPVAASTVFCATCLKNQDIVARLVADYVPDEDDPDYKAAIAGLPAYRERLEQDYPQCCADCEPRARAQLEHATSAAKSDNMLRNLQKTRRKRLHRSLDWRPLVLAAAGVGYASSTAVQLVWHMLGAQGGSRPAYRNPVQCLVSWPAPTRCYQEATSILPLSIAVGFVCSWWNPQLAQKLNGSEGRLTGLARCYAIQGLLLVLRVVCWVLLADFLVDDRLQTMLHATSFIVLTILTGAATFSVRLDTSPRVDWNYEPPRLVSDTQFIPPPVSQEPSFPINDLGGPPQEHLRPWRPPQLESEDAMDWVPSHNLQPRQPKPKPLAPSPFYGKLPSLPGGLRRQEPKPSIGLPPGFFDKRDPLPQMAASASGLAEPRFFPHTIDTGLENMFGQVFSLGDGPEPARFTAETTAQGRHASTSAKAYSSPGAIESMPTETSALPLFSAAVLLLLLGSWMVSEHLLIAIPDLRLYLLGVGALPPASRILKPTVMPTIVFLAETIALVTLAAMVKTFDSNALLKIGASTFGFLIVQELFLFSQQGSGSSVEPSAMPPADPERTPRRPQASAQSRAPPTSPGFGIPRRESAESMFSNHSTSTTSTAPEWKTPRPTRTYAERRESNFGLGGLRL